MRRSWLRSRPKPGSGIPAKVREAVVVRDGGRCRRCGVWLANVPGSVHHRLPRGRGGDARLSNLVLLHGDGVRGCHGEVEAHRAQAYDDGWLVRSGEDPADVAVLAPEGWVLLADDGSESLAVSRDGVLT